MIKSFVKLLTRCYRLALPYGRLKVFMVVGMILFNGLLQLIGVTSVFPFFALAADPERIRKSRFGSWILNFLPPMDGNHLLVVAGFFSIGMLIFASIGSVFSEYIRIRYAYGFCHWLRKRLFESYINQPYAFYLSRNSADLYQKQQDIFTFIYSVLLPVGEVLSRIILIVLLLGGIFIVQTVVAFGAGLLLGGIYLIIFLWIRPRTHALGKGLQQHFLGFAKNTHQLLDGIKAVFVHDRGQYFVDKALYHSYQLGLLQSKEPIYSNGPRYLIEPIAFGGLVAIVIVLALQGRPFSDILPNLSVMAFAGYRLIPALQLLFSQLVSITSHSYTLGQLEEEINDIEQETSHHEGVTSDSNTVSFEKNIYLDKLSFSYPNSEKVTLNNFSLSIVKNESIGIAGPSGSGKSTLVDLILGLHIPGSGRLMVDGVPITKKSLSVWRRMIGYVPQDIYLMDATIQANIAFGVKEEEIDLKALREAARGAQILEFIENELPEGFMTQVGERGVRLSGGQRQRIGLARALYHRPQILILDEATSALDPHTEAAVMETIHRLQGKMTMITIAHRLSTLERCDRIIELVKNSK